MSILNIASAAFRGKLWRKGASTIVDRSVSKRLGRNVQTVDSRFLMMASSSVFILSGGGFSSLVSLVVEQKGLVLEPNNNYDGKHWRQVMQGQLEAIPT